MRRLLHREIERAINSRLVDNGAAEITPGRKCLGKVGHSDIACASPARAIGPRQHAQYIATTRKIVGSGRTVARGSLLVAIQSIAVSRAGRMRL
jgi:hypothetical protein